MPEPKRSLGKVLTDIEDVEKQMCEVPSNSEEYYQLAGQLENLRKERNTEIDRPMREWKQKKRPGRR